MGKQATIIELNGNRYDAITGRMLNSAHANVGTITTPPQAHSKSSGSVIDGFMRRATNAPVKHERMQTAPIDKPTRPQHHSAVPAHQAHAKLTRSKTLMRHAVKKPSKPSTAQPSLAAPTIKPSHAIRINPSRLHRAEHVSKSNLISKFGHIKTGVNKKVESVPVKPAPSHHSVTPATSPPITNDLDFNINPFDMALNLATSHELPKLRKLTFRHRAARKLKVSPKTFSISAGVFVALVLGGLIAYRQMPQFAVRLAATRAGVPASLPSYQPSGFALSGPVQYSAGQISLQYLSNSDDRAFRVVQKTSEWNSQGLLDNFIAGGKRSYQTFQDKGKTIYIYEGSNATWVSGGVWYQIEGESSLNSDQLLRIASSL